MRVLPWYLRRLVHKGRLTLIGPDGTSETFGHEPGPEVTMRVTDPGLDRKFLMGPELAVPEAYMDGTLTFDEGGLPELVAIYNMNIERAGALPVEKAWQRIDHVTRQFILRNSPFRARRNAAHHYDIGNDLYRLFLDEDMQYSCGYFPRGDETIEEAQLAKKRHIAAKMRLEPGQRVLDIGSGWGGMAIYLARMADVEVLGVTLAERQLEVARERAREAGLEDRVKFELMDYRDVKGTFDRIVSVGMMEHVGAKDIPTYFDNVRSQLAPDGVALIHSIFAMKTWSYTDPFVQKYIFPGGYVPTPSEAMSAVERSGLWLLDCEIWRKHYAFTLRRWYERFMANRDKAAEMYDERFCRMWEVYLLGFEASFLTGRLAVMQLQLGNERDAVPLSRDYIVAEADRLRAREAELGISAEKQPAPQPVRKEPSAQKAQEPAK